MPENLGMSDDDVKRSELAFDVPYGLLVEWMFSRFKYRLRDWILDVRWKWFKARNKKR